MAATFASCCLSRLPPPPATASSNPNNLPSAYPAGQLPWFKSDKWRSHCVMGMACVVIIGLETAAGDWTSVEGGAGLGIAAAGTVSEKVTGAGNKRVDPPVRRWSEKRKCAPWQLNSLETIVPENLPRPSASRRWESVELGVGGRRDSPAAGDGVVVRRGSKLGSCFSM